MKAIAHRILDKMPGLKPAIIDGYTFLRYLVYGLFKPRVTTFYPLYAVKDLLPEAWEDYELFFGYYDKPAENSKGYILVNATKNRKTYDLPSADHSIEVLVVDKQNRGKNPLMRIGTTAYNWQQGCRAQWLDDDLFIMNIFEETSQSYISKVFSVKEKKEVKQFSLPVQDSYKKNYFLSINYRRIMALRPDYGYRNLPVPSESELLDTCNDGIWYNDYQNGENKLFLSLQDILRFQANNYPENAKHAVNHLMISPNGEKFIFIHRYFVKGVRYDRLLVANVLDKYLKLLANTQMVSHCNWLDDEHIIAYLRSPEGKDAYFIISVETGKMEWVDYALFNKYGDGHPSSNGKLIISDSYQDHALQRHLICHDNASGQTMELGSFYQAMRFKGECRCDLHPRFSQNGKTLYFDSVFSGQRGLYFFELSTE